MGGASVDADLISGCGKVAGVPEGGFAASEATRLVGAICIYRDWRVKCLMGSVGTATRKKRNSNWGGRRPNAGRPPSDILKKKISVMVTTERWDQALELWGRSGGQLINQLIDDFIAGNTGQQD